MRDLSNVSLLLVEDHANMRNLWRTILLGFGVRKVHETSEALEAIDILRVEQVDVAFVDHILPDISGAEMVRMVRFSQDYFCHIPVIACTADTRRSTIRELVNSGVDEVLAKPVSAEQAWRKMVSVVNRRRSFIQTTIYLGPDRRRRNLPYSGPDRRASAAIPD